MDNLTVNQDDRLLEYLDGKLSNTQLQLLKSDLDKSVALKNRLEELRVIHRVLASTKLEDPQGTFVTKVMQNLHSVSKPTTLSARNGLLLLGGTMVAAAVLVWMISAGIFDQFHGMITLEKAAPVTKYLQHSVPQISINVKLLIKVLVGVYMVVAFIVLDRTVLKPFFQRRAGMQL